MHRPRWMIVLVLTTTLVAAYALGARPVLTAHPMPAPTRTTVQETDSNSIIHGPMTEPPARNPIYLPSRPMTIAETKTRLKLHQKVPMNFPKDTSLEDIKKYIETSTIDPVDFPEGIPIYFDREGLQDADKTMASTVAIDLKGMPLETTLRLLLKQVSMAYWVNRDGLVIITSNNANDPLIEPGDIDREILTNLSALRSEIKELRAELQVARRSQGLPEIPGAETPRRQGMGVNGGFP